MYWTKEHWLLASLTEDSFVPFYEEKDIDDINIEKAPALSSIKDDESPFSTALEPILKSSAYLSQHKDSNEVMKFISFALEEDDSYLLQEKRRMLALKDKRDLFLEGMQRHYMNTLVTLADKLTYIEDCMVKKASTNSDVVELGILHRSILTHFNKTYDYVNNTPEVSILPPVSFSQNIHISNTTNSATTTTEVNQVNLSQGKMESVESVKTNRLALQRINNIMESILKHGDNVK